MPEYDPFGRPIEPDGPRVGIGSTESATPAPAEPAQDEGFGYREATPELTAPPRSRAVRGAGGCLVAIFALAAVLAGLGFAAAGLISSVSDTASDVRDTIDGFSVDREAPADPRAPRPEARDVPSPTTPAGLGRALRILQRDVPGRVRLLRIDGAGRVDVQVVRKGRLSVAQLADGATATRVFVRQQATGQLQTFPYDAVRTGAPRTLIRQASKRLRTPARRVDYLVAIRSTGALEWLVFFKNGRSAAGDARGRLTRVVNG